MEVVSLLEGEKFAQLVLMEVQSCFYRVENVGKLEKIEEEVLEVVDLSKINAVKVVDAAFTFQINKYRIKVLL